MKTLHVSIIGAVSLGLITCLVLFMRSTHPSKQPVSLSLNTAERSLNTVETSPESSFKNPKNENPELAKLEKRKERWQKAKKCSQALLAINGRVEELCASVPDIHLLAKEAGVGSVIFIVKSHLESLETYEDQLKEGIISNLPQDSPMTISTRSSLIDAEEADSKSVQHRWETQSKICLLRAQVGEVNYENCKSQADSAYETYEQESELRRNKIEDALEKFEDNYKEDL